MLQKYKHLYNSLEENKIFSPEFFRLNNPDEKLKLNKILESGRISFINDEIKGQLKELIKSQNPSIRIKEGEYEILIDKKLNGLDLNDYGVWVFFPWSKRLVHILDKEEFIEVRTNRNQYKITREERDILSTKKIGIIGLSVGQSIALTLCMERGFGELRLADFDILELSNLNRIRTGIHNLAVPKVIITAREIAEIDPFLKVNCFTEGLSTDNIDQFFTDSGNLDLLIDECDGLDIKILSRYKARELKIPVLMDTSDRGMLDVERFDLEPSRPILHGTVADINPQTIQNLSNEEKIPIILQILGIDNISLRAKVSLVEVEQSINTWPQLASSVTLGGAVGADVCRRILLDQFHDSGRYYIDLEELIADKKNVITPVYKKLNPFEFLSVAKMKSLVSNSIKNAEGFINPDSDTITNLVNSACAAPSTGNDQPWKWLYSDSTLYLFHDKNRSYSFGDFQSIASYISFGAAFENLSIHAKSIGIEPILNFCPIGEDNDLVATIRFKTLSTDDQNENKHLFNAIFKRNTNRNIVPKTTIPIHYIDQLKSITELIEGASIKIFSEDKDLKIIAKIVGACDRTRMLNPEGHFDFVHKEMRWTEQEADNKRDGIDIRTLGLGNSQMAALSAIKDERVISTLRNLNKGNAFDMLAARTVETASAMCMITMPKYNLKNFFDGGRSMQKFWLTATHLNIAVHPLNSPFYIFPRILHGNSEGLSENNTIELQEMRKLFETLTGFDQNRAEVFLAKITLAPEPQVKTKRLPLFDILTIE